MKNLKIMFCFCLVQSSFSQMTQTDPFPNNTIDKTIDTLNIIQLYPKVDPNFDYQFSQPKVWDMFKYIPNDLYQLGIFAIQKKNLKWNVLTLSSTAALIPFDQKILDNAGEFGHKIGGWDEDSRYKRVAGSELITTSIFSGVYYIGNGNTTLLLSGMFLAIKKINNGDLRALNTSNELVEVLLSVGVATQTIKRTTGRQSPKRALADGNDGGAWSPFPCFTDYQKNTPNYDAMPSGHIATFMATVTVIATNYLEIKWIKPVGYSLMSVLAFNMVSGKLHWASDYPIAILMGYVMGKNIANRRITKIAKTKAGLLPTKASHYKLDYTINSFHNSGLAGATLTF